MHKVTRSLLFAGIVALGGLAACGDDITIPPQPPTVTLAPNPVQVAVGGTATITPAVNNAQGTVTRTWATGNAAVATVDQNGVVTGVANGSTAITLTVTGSNGTAVGTTTVQVGAGDGGQASVTIQGVNVTVCGTAGCNSVPATLNNITGQIDVTLNVETAGQPVQRVELVVRDVASGAETVCGTQNITSGVVAAEDAEAAAAQVPITISCNTARTTAAGVAEFLNGNKEIRARLIGANGQTINAAANTFAVTFANVDGIVWTVTNTGTNTGFPSSAIGDEGLLWIQGTINLNFSYVNYTSGTGAQAATITGSMFGYNFSAVPSAGQNFTVTFPATGTFGTARSLNGYTSPETGDAPTFTSVVTSGGQPVPAVTITPGANQAPVVRVDNAAPGVLANVLPATATNPVPMAPAYSARTRFTAPFYVNGQFAFAGVAGAAPGAASTSNALVGTGVDAGVNKNTVRFFAGAPATFPANGTAGLTEIDAGSDLAATLTSSAYRTRALVSDALGNTATITQTSTFGVDLVGPQGLDYDAASPADSTGYTADQTFQIVPGDLTDDASGVASLRVSITRQTADASFSCPVPPYTAGTNPTNGQCPFITVPTTFTFTAPVAADGYYTVRTVAQDQAENPSDTVTRVILVDDGAPTFVGGLTVPGQITPGAALSFQVDVSDNIDLGKEFLTATYASLANPIRLDSVTTSTFGAPLVKTATPTVTAASFIASVAVATGGALPATGGTLASTATVVARDIAGNVATSAAALPAGNFILTGATANTNWADAAIASWAITAPAAAVNVKNGTANNTTSPTVTLAAELRGVAGNTTWDTPFSRVVFWYLDPATGEYVAIGEATRTVVTTGTTPNEVRTFRYEIANWNPPADLGTAANLTIIATGIRNGHALATDANTNITLVP